LTTLVEVELGMDMGMGMGMGMDMDMDPSIGRERANPLATVVNHGQEERLAL
jgi:hypothetical protein